MLYPLTVFIIMASLTIFRIMGYFFSFSQFFKECFSFSTLGSNGISEGNKAAISGFISGNSVLGRKFGMM